MKTHLHTGRKDQDRKMSMIYACNGSQTVNVTKNHEEVTCLNCKKTDEYRYAKANQKLKDETMQIGKDIVAKQKQSKNATYKQDSTISLTVPVGYEFDRSSVIGQHTDGKGVDIEVFFKKKVKTGAELVGCLCGYSDKSLEEAKENAEKLYNVAIIKAHRGLYYRIKNGGLITHAYPVQADKLDELKAKLMEG